MTSSSTASKKSPTASALLETDMLERFRARASAYDAENRFFSEDLEELRSAGYLAAPVPISGGGSGASLAELVALQRHLAAHAPATALGVNMHLVWVQVARFLHDRGIETLDWVLDDAVAGEIFAFGISEPGNKAVLMDAFSTAQPDDAGYVVSGTKVFTTLSPVWTRLGVHAREEVGTDDPALVFGFVRRGSAAGRALEPRSPEEGSLDLDEGAITHPGTWNPLGMRATQSWTSALECVRIRQEDIAATFPPFDPSNPLILAIFSSFSLLTAAVYAGIADRAFELAREAANRPDPMTRDDGTGLRLDDPDIAAKLTEATLQHRASLDALEVLARDVDDQRSREDWFLALAAARNRVTDEARSAVDLAMRLGGSRAYQADSEIARLYRDVAAGLYHPSSAESLASTVRASLRDE